MQNVQIKSGQTRAVLARKARAGEDNDRLLREKRMGDLAWQMNVTSLKLNSFRENNEAAKARLQQLFNEAKAEFDRLQFEMDIDDVA